MTPIDAWCDSLLTTGAPKTNLDQLKQLFKGGNGEYGGTFTVGSLRDLGRTVLCAALTKAGFGGNYLKTAEKHVQYSEGEGFEFAEDVPLQEVAGIGVVAAGILLLIAGGDILERHVRECGLGGLVTGSAGGLVTDRFIIARQHYLELLEAGQPESALECLRAACTNDLLAIASTRAALPDSIHELGAWLMCTSAADIWVHTGGRGVLDARRHILLEKLQARMPPSRTLPSNQMVALLQQAVQTQSFDRGWCALAYSRPELCPFSRDRIPRECAVGAQTRPSTACGYPPADSSS
jgi:hypothetical protein